MFANISRSVLLHNPHHGENPSLFLLTEFLLFQLKSMATGLQVCPLHTLNLVAARSPFAIPGMFSSPLTIQVRWSSQGLLMFSAPSNIFVTRASELSITTRAAHQECCCVCVAATPTECTFSSKTEETEKLRVTGRRGKQQTERNGLRCWLPTWKKHLQIARAD